MSKLEPFSTAEVSFVLSFDISFQGLLGTSHPAHEFSANMKSPWRSHGLCHHCHLEINLYSLNGVSCTFLFFGHFWLCHADAQRAKSHPAAGLRSPQPTHGILLGGGYILLEAEKLLKSAPLVDELKSHIMYMDLSWCRTDWNHFPSQHNTCSRGKMVRHLATFHSSYVWYYTAIPFCAYPNLLCPWSFGCCRAKLSILSQSVNHSMLSDNVISQNLPKSISSKYSRIW